MSTSLRVGWSTCRCACVRRIDLRKGGSPVHAPLIAWIGLLAGQQEAPRIEVREDFKGCRGRTEQNDVWVLEGDAYRCGKRTIGVREVEDIRRIVLDAPEEIPDLLASVGVTPETVAEHRDKILFTALPDVWKYSTRAWPARFGPELEQLLTYESIAKQLENKLLDRGWVRTYSLLLEVTLPGEPVVTVRGRGNAPWMLPWTITTGERTWTTPDVRVSRALLRLADPAGSCRSKLDGHDYWAEGVYRDVGLWSFVGRALESAFTKELFARIAGFEEADARFRIGDVITSGPIGLDPAWIQLHLSSRQPSLIGGASWEVPLEGEEPLHTWRDFLAVYDAALIEAQRHPWLAEWKAAGPERSIGLDAKGTRGRNEPWMADSVVPAWEHAGMAGKPEIELLLFRNNERCAQVFLSRDEPRALIVRAHRLLAKMGEHEHWLDRLEFSFHPTGPTYALVGPDGVPAIRRAR